MKESRTALEGAPLAIGHDAGACLRRQLVNEARTTGDKLVVLR